MVFDTKLQTMRPTTVFERVTMVCEKYNPVLTIVDTQNDAFSGNANDPGQARQFVTAWRRIAIRHNGVVLPLSHPSRRGEAEGTGDSGSVAWMASARQHLYMTRGSARKGKSRTVVNLYEEDPDLRRIEVMSSNRSRSGNMVIKARWRAGRFDVEEILDDKKLTKEAKQDRSEAAFIACLRKAMNLQKKTSHQKTSPTTYAPRMFADWPEAKEQSVLALEAAMKDRLMSRQRVVIVNSSEAPSNDSPARKTKVLMPEKRPPPLREGDGGARDPTARVWRAIHLFPQFEMLGQKVSDRYSTAYPLSAFRSFRARRSRGWWIRCLVRRARLRAVASPNHRGSFPDDIPGVSTSTASGQFFGRSSDGNADAPDLKLRRESEMNVYRNFAHSGYAAIAGTALLITVACSGALAQSDPLPSWNDTTAKRAIVEFVTETTKEGSGPSCRPPSGSPPSIRMARSGWSTRCTARSSTAWTRAGDCGRKA